MFAVNRCARLLAFVAAIGMVASPVFGAAPIAKNQNSVSAVRPTVFDVKLSGNKVLGQVVTTSGKPSASSAVTLVSKREAVGKVATDQLGRFQLPVQKPGVYHVAVGERSFTIRAWNPAVAPPAAKDSLLCVMQEATVRGQCGGCGSYGACPPTCGAAAACGPAACGPCGLGGGGFGGGGGLMSLLSNPVVIGLGVAAAIALPIALDDDDDDNGGTAGGSGEPAS